MKTIKYFCIILLITINVFSQNKTKKKVNEPTKIETEQWISENIYSYSKKDYSFSNSYDLKFNDGLLLIKYTLVYTSGTSTTVKSDYFIPIKEISYVRFETFDDAVFLRFVLKNNEKVKCKYETDNDFTYPQEFHINLSSAFKDNDMINRMTKAFNNLIKLNGGTVSKNTY
ncbi:hypothetical protein IT9_230019 [Flavobacterium psychrophilum]|uniref:hypothetical protein n=1 Tax=Flavobacterium psychrophilum TaxID=96345 RepID=UPI000B7C4E89|nr:hypothetical protein [Flavobacterium psychrophilum]SNB09224.1 hypothetical protein IT9_230019 [Flavobacterium psychrophilum]